MLPATALRTVRSPTHPAPARIGRSLAALAVSVVVLLAALAGLVPRIARAEPPKAPFAAAVLPFADRRHPGQPSWLGLFLQERIARALNRAPQVSVLPLDAAAQWQRKLGLDVDAAPTADQLHSLGVAVAVQGATQEVLRLADVELYARNGEGDLLKGTAGRLQIDLRNESPAHALERVLGALQDALVPQTHLAEPSAPTDWTRVEELYTLLGQPLVAGDRGVRPELVAKLRPYTRDPGLAGRAHEALASLLLEQALLYLPEGPGRELMLAEALQHATAALLADPLDTHRQALKAELHYFLKQFYESKTDASIARIRNPQESLAFVVLGLAAGLSTGEATEQFRHATALHPFLRTAARMPGSEPYQGGILEPLFTQWESLRASGGLRGDDDYPRLVAEGIAQFDRHNWERAEALLRQAAGREEADYVPLLYLNRILIELGHPERAVPNLQRLAAGNPQEADILVALGQALTESGEPAAGLDAYRRALAEQPDNVKAHEGIAETEMALEHWPQAQLALRNVLQRAPESATAWRQLGEVQMHLQDWSGAQDALQRALELRPGWPEAETALVEVHRHLGKPAPAAGAGAAPPAVAPADPPRQK